MNYNPIFNFSDFPGQNDTEKFSYAMECLRNHPGSALYVAPGIYNITSHLARETMENVLTGKYGNDSQSTIFRPEYKYARGIDFYGQKNTALIGYGAVFVIDGFMEVFSLRDCSNVTLMGVTIRHKRKPYGHGTVRVLSKRNREDGSYDCRLCFDNDCPIYENTPLQLKQLYWDPKSDKMVYARFILDRVEDAHHANGKIIDADFNPDGIEFYLSHTYHFRPAVLIERACNITIRDITINNQPGMGIVGNRSENVLIQNISVVPLPGEHFSTNTDGTHFTSMKGLLRIQDCTFEGTGDDFTNVHGYYHRAVKREGLQVVYLQEKTPDGTHAQTLDYPDIGDKIEMTDYSTMKVLDTFTVVDCTPMPNEWMCRVVLDHDTPENTDNVIFADITRMPRLEIVGCRSSNHIARGVLCKCRDALIEGNVFRNVQGPAIQLGAESFWFEGICPANITVKNNIIDNCGIFWGKASGIVVMADCDDPVEKTISNITIENNLIYSPEVKHGIFIRNTIGGSIQNNTIDTLEDPVVMTCCEDVTINL